MIVNRPKCPKCNSDPVEGFQDSWDCGSWVGLFTRTFHETPTCELYQAINLLRGVQKERGIAGLPDPAGQILYQNLDDFLARYS